MTGFGHGAVLSVASKVIDAVKAGAISIQVAVALAKAFNCSVNELPLNMVFLGTSKKPCAYCSLCCV